MLNKSDNLFMFKNKVTIYLCLTIKIQFIIIQIFPSNQMFVLISVILSMISENIKPLKIYETLFIILLDSQLLKFVP